MNSKIVALKYVGKGWWLPGIPARDLTQEDLDDLGLNNKSKKEMLVKSGLYQEVKLDDPPENKAVKNYANKEM